MVDEIALRRFDRTSDPKQCRPTDALEAARAWIEQDEKGKGTQHVIVFVGRSDPDGGSFTRYFQAGSYSTHAQLGLCFEATKMLTE